jgi:hypothetical protein
VDGVQRGRARGYLSKSRYFPLAPFPTCSLLVDFQLAEGIQARLSTELRRRAVEENAQVQLSAKRTFTLA